MKRAVRLLIIGNMQGIFYRQFMREQADKNKVKGFMREIPNKGVEVFIEGNLADVEKMVEACKVGPKSSHVRNIEIKDERFQDFKEFKVLSF